MGFDCIGRPGPLARRAGIASRAGPVNLAVRDNVSDYDAFYVVLAQQQDATIITADARLSRAPGLPVPVQVVS